MSPGSDEAVAAGCLCPVLDNARGRGAWGSDGEIFWRVADCPLHGEGTNTRRENPPEKERE